MSAHKEVTDHADKECKDWSLTPTQIKNVLRKFKSVTSEDQNYGYEAWNCTMTGVMRIDGNEFIYYLEAAATLILKKEDSYYYFGCSDASCKKYFLSIELTKEELQEF